MSDKSAIEWRLIPSHPNYEASSAGQVRRRTAAPGTWPGRILKTPPDGGGYLQVNIDGRPVRVHVLVAEAFLGPIPAGAEIHHRNGDRADPRLANLLVMPSRLAHREHHRRRPSGRRRHGEGNPLIACACGCGQHLSRFDSGGRSREFVTGHNCDFDTSGRYAPRRRGGEANAR